MKRFMRFARWLVTLLATLGLGWDSYLAVRHAMPWFFPAGVGLVTAVLWAMLLAAPPRSLPRAAPVAPLPPARSPRYPDGAPEGTCPVCGMDDAERFRLRIGVTGYRGQPAHSTCVEWIGPEPKHAPPPGTAFVPCQTYRGAGGSGGFIFTNSVISAFGVPPAAMGTATTIPPSSFGYEPWPLNLPRAGSTVPTTTPALTGYGSDGLPGLYATLEALAYARTFPRDWLLDLSEDGCAITLGDLQRRAQIG